jgi:hypothetical protein
MGAVTVGRNGRLPARVAGLERRTGFLPGGGDDDPPRWFPLEPTVAVLQQLKREHHAEGLGLSEEEMHRAHVAEAIRRLLEWWRCLGPGERAAVRRRVAE